MPVSYSYKVRVLAALDAHYNPSKPTPISLRSIDSRYESDCNANRLFLPSTWRKRVKITLDKLVAENWLIEKNGSYIIAPRLRTIIADEKVRFNVNQRNHEWRIFASIAKKTEMVTISGSGNVASSSTPAGRTRARTSLSTANATPVKTPIQRDNNQNSPYNKILSVTLSGTPATRTRNQSSLVRVEATSPAPADIITVRKQATGRRKVRYSDPGPILSQAVPSSSTPTITRKRISLGSSFQDPVVSAISTGASSPRRHRNIVPSRTNRRHTLAVAPTRQQFTFPEPVEPISREIQFFPLKQTLSARTRRALRRNALSEEMNDIDAERRASQKQNRELLAKLRAELAESSERLRELERELAAARFAPSVEPEELAQINEEEEDEDYDMGYVPSGSPGPYAPVTPVRQSPSSAEHYNDVMGVEQTPSSNRDQKIRDLEAMIEALRQDIAHRAEEERLRAQEDEVFHDAEEQIMHEENHALAEKIEELTALKGKNVSFNDDIEEIQQEEEVYMGPLTEDSGDEVTDGEEHPEYATFHSSGVDSGIGASSQMTMEMDLQDQRVAELENQNERLRETISTLGEQIQEMEGNLEETQMSLAERKRAQDKLKKENERLRRLEKELEVKVTELEEMEGERLENVGHMLVQTDDIVYEGKVEMEVEVDSLTEQVVELQEMIKVVTGEKRDAQVKITATDAQISALKLAAEADEAAKLEAEAQILGLTLQIAEIQDTVSKEKREIEHAAQVAHAQIAILEEAASTSKAVRINAESQVQALTTQVKALEAIIAEERKETEVRIADLQAVVQSGEDAKNEAQTQITRLVDQIREIETTATKENGKVKTQITDLQGVIESTEAARKEAQAQIRNLDNQVKNLEEAIKMEQMDAESKIIAANAEIAELEATIESSEAAMEDAESQIRVLGREILDLQTEASDLEKERNEMQQEIEILNRQVERLEGEIEELREENVGLKEEVKDLEKKSKGFEGTIDSLNQEKNSLEKDVESLKERIEGLEDAAAGLKKSNAALEADYTNLDSQLKTQLETTKLAEKASVQFQQNIAELRSHIKTFEKAAEVSRSEKESFERDIASLQGQVSSLENARKLSGDENQDLQDNIDELHTQIESFKQCIEVANQEKGQLEGAITDLYAQVEALKRAGKVVELQKESLQQIVNDLNTQLTKLGEELDASRAENNLSTKDIENYKSEIHKLNNLLDAANRDKDDLRHDIHELEEKVVSLEGEFKGSYETNRCLEHNIETLRAEITALKQASEIADEQKYIIHQKIRPYIQSEQSLDMAVEEVLTELVMAKNRADENERLRTELSNKIKILAQDDMENDSGSINPEEIIEKLIDRFKEVRGSVEKLYLREKSQGSLFGGHNLEDFAWTGSNEDALTMLGSLVEVLCEKVASTHTRVEDLKDSYEKEKNQVKLYGGYLEDVAMAVSDGGQLLPEKAQTLDLVTLRLSKLRQQIEAAEERAEELNEAVTRKDNTIRVLEMDIDSAGQRETDLNKKIIDTIAAHSTTTTRLSKALIEVEELSTVIEDKDEDIEKLEATLEELADKERSHNNTIKDIEQRKDEAINAMQKRLDDMREAKTKVEHMFTQARQENELVVKTLHDALDASRAEIDKTAKELEARKVSYQQTIEMLEGTLAQSRGQVVEVSRMLHEQAEKSSSDILALEAKLRSSSEEVKHQVSALKRAEAQRDKITKQLNFEMESNQEATAVLEQKIQKIIVDAEVQQEGDQQIIASLKLELLTIKSTADEEKRLLHARIHSQAENISRLTSRIEELEELLEEVEDSERVLDEHLKVTESQSQLFQEEASKAQESLMSEKSAILKELAELKRKSDITQTKMESDITALKVLVEKKSQRVQELENVVSILQDERSKLQETIDELDEEGTKLEDMLEMEQRKSAEAVQNLTNETMKYMARFGDVKNQFARENRLRQGERLKNRRKRAREEQEDEEGGANRMPPTPASSVVTGPGVIEGVKKRESKRRRYDGIGADSGIGVDIVIGVSEEEDEEFDGVSAVGA